MQYKGRYNLLHIMFDVKLEGQTETYDKYSVNVNDRTLVICFPIAWRNLEEELFWESLDNQVDAALANDKQLNFT